MQKKETKTLIYTLHKKHLFFKAVKNSHVPCLSIRPSHCCTFNIYGSVLWRSNIFRFYLFIYLFLHFVNCLSCGTFTTLCHRNLKTFDFIFFFRFIICVSWDKISSKSKFHKTYFVFYKKKTKLKIFTIYNYFSIFFLSLSIKITSICGLLENKYA